MSSRFMPSAAALLFGFLYAASLTNDVDGFPLGILAWVALLPLYAVINGATARQAFWRGWGAGLVAFTGTVYWVITAMNQYGQVPMTVSVLLMLLLATYLGLYVGIYAFGAVIVGRKWPTLGIVGLPALWVTLEWIRNYAFSGLPWGVLGYSQFRFLPIIQLADITGVYGISFLIVLVNSALYRSAQVLLRRTLNSDLRPIPVAHVGIALVMVTATWAYGSWRIDQEDGLNATRPSLSIGIVQANIDQAHKWDAAYRLETMERYTRLTTQAAPGTDLIIWPEAATPFLYEEEPAYQNIVSSLVRQLQVPLLFGSPVLRRHADGRPYLFNSAYLLSTSGEIAGRYDKQHLVPFGEYIPVRWLLFFLDKLVVGIGDFESGPGPTLMTLHDHPARPAFGVAICFEVIFPDLVRQLANAGAQLLVTITNDAWFGDTVAPNQHFAMVVLRAVENRMAFARAANTGISGFITPTGRILAATPIFTEQYLTGRVSLRPPSTFYTTMGDVFAWACVILTVFLLLLRKQVSREMSSHIHPNRT